MPRRFRPFRSSWSLLLVIAALVFTMAACIDGPTKENSSTNCTYDPNAHTCY